jgi:LPXTG-motif cell wall-anchored protein
VVIGYFAFDEIPGALTMLGAALIVIAGLVLVKRAS